MSEGQVGKMDRVLVDWNMILLSPGGYYGREKVVDENPPTFVWWEYDWTKFGDEPGYYVVELGVIEDGYHTVWKATVNEASYTPEEPLQVGKQYLWHVRAYSAEGSVIAGNSDDYYFTFE